MRGASDRTALTCSFIDDVEGGCLVDTPDGPMCTGDMNDYGVPFYLKDGREIFYPSWCDW